MRRRSTSRRRKSRGFALAEALVSLSVAAVTLALLTSATWGLRQAAPSSTDLQNEAADWLIARRVLQAWASAATVRGLTDIEGQFSGSPTQMRLLLDDASSGGSERFMASLDVVVTDGQYALVARKHTGIRDTRVDAERPQTSVVLVSNQALRLVYLVRRESGLGEGWSYDPSLDQGLPIAVAIEEGSERKVIARLPVTRSAGCLSRFGRGGLEERECRVR
ncbi:hypothetical protein [Litoreibacter roseus]|uniref:Prepilin-type N-terminal cleavage/methylation domain-containing protein n=1 Tax=Litoreibacter roseus TaxID=2601869 RepID=A0A6N6JK38_9RHOB|nr:hypothetical protein [Litoreibacter roseus]GFE66494.1 hypothetical protein KIN_35680 [Litoreibacter roseus]